MSTAREQANTRRAIAQVFLTIAAILVLLMLTGMIAPDTTGALSRSAARGMKLAFYLAPAAPFIFAVLFWVSSKKKLQEAEREENAPADQKSV